MIKNYLHESNYFVCLCVCLSVYMETPACLSVCLSILTRFPEELKRLYNLQPVDCTDKRFLFNAMGKNTFKRLI